MWLLTFLVVWCTSLLRSLIDLFIFIFITDYSFLQE